VAYTSESEKLEQRYRENPKGRNFAPLADAYRKAGLLDNAIELCKSGLERHPDYVSAHIVYGRCLIDQKNDPAAADVFRKVVSLDPENVLGLRLLSEIAVRAGRFEEAVDWLTKLLAADPMNGEAAEALARAKGKLAQAAPKVAEPVVRKLEPPAPAAAPAPLATNPTPTPTPPPPPTLPPPPPKPEFVVEHMADEAVAAELAAGGHPRDIETFDGTIDLNPAAREVAKADGIELQEEVELTPQDLVVEGLAHTQFESVFAAPSEEPTVDLPLIMPDELPPDPVAARPVAAAQRRPAAPGGAAPGSGTSSPPPAAVALSDDDGAADTAALSHAEPVLTETMAELYLKQGHREDALRVYEALLAQRPRDPRLRARVEALAPAARPLAGGAGGGTGESVQAFLKRILAGRPRASGGGPVGESPLQSAFAVAPVDPEPPPAIDAPGEATYLAEDTISLDQVFGDESSTGESLPVPPPEPAPPAPAVPAPAAPDGSGGFSFDQFFGGPGSGSAGAAGGTPAASRPSGPKPRMPTEDEGDLDQFQAWLKGLKS